MKNIAILMLIFGLFAADSYAQEKHGEKDRVKQSQKCDCECDCCKANPMHKKGSFGSRGARPEFNRKHPMAAKSSGYRHWEQNNGKKYADKRSKGRGKKSDK